MEETCFSQEPPKASNTGPESQCLEGLFSINLSPEGDE
jgi:hypothetical protein